MAKILAEVLTAPQRNEKVQGIQLAADLASDCRAKAVGNQITIEGLFSDHCLSVVRQLAGSLQELAAELTGARLSDISQVVQVILDLASNSHKVVVLFTFPANLMPQVISTEMHSALLAFASESGQEATTDNQAKLHERPRALINAALTKLKKAHGKKTLPKGLEVRIPGCDEPIRFPSEIGEAQKTVETAPPRQAQGAFRGYFIEAREAFFIESGSHKRRKPLIFCFDEERFFEKIKALSNRQFTTCTVSYVEHFKDGKLDYLQLLDIVATSHDLFE